MRLVSILTRSEDMLLFVCSEAVESNLVKLETSRAYSDPPLWRVFFGLDETLQTISSRPRRCVEKCKLKNPTLAYSRRPESLHRHLLINHPNFFQNVFFVCFSAISAFFPAKVLKFIGE